MYTPCLTFCTTPTEYAAGNETRAAVPLLTTLRGTAVETRRGRSCAVHTKSCKIWLEIYTFLEKFFLLSFPPRWESSPPWCLPLFHLPHSLELVGELDVCLWWGFVFLDSHKNYIFWTPQIMFFKDVELFKIGYHVLYVFWCFFLVLCLECIVHPSFGLPYVWIFVFGCSA
jgi:hypothetical protein